VLALPTYLLMRRDNRIENGDLHPALSSLFRVTDGLRMTMHQMLFVPIGEPALKPDAPMNSAEIYAYAERNYSFHSEHGVCAGPRAMMEEFFSVLVDGITPKSGLPPELDPQVRDALADLDPVIDYALLGLQAYAAVFSVWPAMARTYETLGSIASSWALAGPAPVTALRDHLWNRILHIAKAGYLTTEERRVDRERVYADMYAQCAFGLAGAAPDQSLPERISVRPTSGDEAAERQLRGALVRYLGVAAYPPIPHLDAMHSCLMAFLRQTQGILRVACETQRSINTLLGRKQPERPFDAADIDIHIRLRGDTGNRSPYLLNDLEEILGIHITLDENDLVINDQLNTVTA
jgi:hypothetical protein